MSDEIKLPDGAPMSAYQEYVTRLEELHGWLEVDLVHNCFLMGEEVGELFKSIRKHLRYYEEHDPEEEARSKLHVSEEIVDVFNYLLAIANRLEIDVEGAFRRKNLINQGRTWASSAATTSPTPQEEGDEGAGGVEPLGAAEPISSGE